MGVQTQVICGQGNLTVDLLRGIWRVFCLFISMSNQCKWFERPFATKNTAYHFMQLFRGKFLVCSMWDSSLENSYQPSARQNATLNTREKWKFRVWRTLSFTHWLTSLSLRLLGNFYKQLHLRDLSLFITCVGRGRGQVWRALLMDDFAGVTI